MRGRWGSRGIALGTVAILGVFLAWPLADVVYRSVHDSTGLTGRYLVALVTNPQDAAVLAKTTLIAVLVTAACMLVSVPLAWLFARRQFAGKTLFSGLLLVPMILPPFVGAVGMKMLLSRAGPLSMLAMELGLSDGFVDWMGASPLAGIVALEALHLFPILYLNLVAAFANIDPAVEEAARNCGATPWRVFTRVTLPLCAPGIFAGLILVFIWSFTELGTPLVFGVRDVLPVRIFSDVNEIGTNPMGYARVVLVLVLTVLGFLVSKAVTRRGRDVATFGRVARQGNEVRLGRGATAAVWAALGLLVALALLPHAGVLGVASFKKWFLTILPEGPTLAYYGRAMSEPITRQAIFNSMGLAVVASLLDVALGLGIAWTCVRGRIRGSDWLDAISMLPLAVPGLVIAFGYLGCFPRHFAGSWLDPRMNPMPLLAISYAIRRLPYMVRSCHAGLEQVSPAYEEAAMNCGATPLRAVWRVTRPLIAANILAGGILCFSFSMLEVSDSLILAQSEEFYPITKAIYQLLGSLENGANVASALGVWAMVLLGSALVWVSVLLGKKAGSMFRAG